MKIMAVDPGITTGVAYVDEDQVELTTVRLWHGLDALLDRFKPEVIIIENFRLFPSAVKAQIGNEMLTVRVIGAAMYMAELRHVAVVLQEPSVKMGILLKKTPKIATGEHPWDALMHVMYFLKARGESLDNLKRFIKPVRMPRNDNNVNRNKGQPSNLLDGYDPFKTSVHRKHPRSAR